MTRNWIRIGLVPHLDKKKLNTIRIKNQCGSTTLLHMMVYFFTHRFGSRKNNPLKGTTARLDRPENGTDAKALSWSSTAVCLEFFNELEVLNRSYKIPLIPKFFGGGLVLKAVLRIRIRIRIRPHMFLGLPDPDPLVRCMDPDPALDPDPDPDPSIIMQK